jgi:hypothetical protein
MSYSDEPITDEQRERLARIGASISWGIEQGPESPSIFHARPVWVITDKRGATHTVKERKAAAVDAKIDALEQRERESQ